MRLLARRLAGFLQTKTTIRTVLPSFPKISAFPSQIAQNNTGTSKLFSSASAKSIRTAEPQAKISGRNHAELNNITI